LARCRSANQRADERQLLELDHRDLGVGGARCCRHLLSDEAGADHGEPALVAEHAPQRLCVLERPQRADVLATLEERQPAGARSGRDHERLVAQRRAVREHHQLSAGIERCRPRPAEQLDLPLAIPVAITKDRRLARCVDRQQIL